LLPGVLGLGGYLGPKVFLAASAKACKQQESRKFPGANDTACSRFGYNFRIGGMEQNPGPGIEGESIIQLLCSGCDRILKSGTRCETCDRWYNNSCGNGKVKWQKAGRGTAIRVDMKGFNYFKRNCKTLSSKLMS
jgi:hypothetical protein